MPDLRRNKKPWALAVLCLILLSLTTAARPAHAGNGLDSSDSPHALRSRAFSHLINNETDKALNYFELAVERAKKDFGEQSSYVSDLYFEMGTVAYETGKFQKAETYLSEAVKRNPNSVQAHVKLAEVYRTKAKQDEALSEIQKALQHDKNSIEARRQLVLWLIDRRNLAAAIKESYVLNQDLKAIEDAKTVSDTPRLATLPRWQPGSGSTPSVSTSKPESSVAPTQDIAPSKVLSTIWQSRKPKPRVVAPPVKAESVKAAPAKIEPKPVQAKAPPPKPKIIARVEQRRQPKDDSHTYIKTTAKALNVPHSKHTAAQSKQEKEPDSEKSNQSDESGQENQVASKKTEEPPKQAMQPMVPQMGMPMIPYFPQAFQAQAPHKPKTNGLVPPPPPLSPVMPAPVFFGGGGFAPPSRFGAQATAGQPKKRAKPTETPKPSKEPDKEEPAASAPAGKQEDPDFLLDWGEVKKKGK